MSTDDELKLLTIRLEDAAESSEPQVKTLANALLRYFKSLDSSPIGFRSDKNDN